MKKVKAQDLESSMPKIKDMDLHEDPAPAEDLADFTALWESLDQLVFRPNVPSVFGGW